jgi:hypothetical protein
MRRIVTGQGDILIISEKMIDDIFAASLWPFNWVILPGHVVDEERLTGTLHNEVVWG